LHYFVDSHSSGQRDLAISLPLDTINILFIRPISSTFLLLCRLIGNLFSEMEGPGARKKEGTTLMLRSSTPYVSWQEYTAEFFPS
jgi:hypothetical protein